ncbi:MAG TPA: hypothetical protein VG965_01390 [Patescibacteria group bacterium]|nr:hypothetical protein [Patescibacteria group bacterium]
MIKDEDKQQILSRNKLAQEIDKRALPLDLDTNLIGRDSLLIDRGQPFFAVPLRFGVHFLTTGHNRSKDQNKSWAAIRVFQDLTKLALESSLTHEQLTNDTEMVMAYRQTMLDTIRANARGASAVEVNQLADEFERTTADASRLSIVGLGADFQLYLDEYPLFKDKGYTKAMAAVIEDFLRPKFYASFKEKNPWFIHPGYWDKNKDTRVFLRSGMDAHRLAIGMYPHLDIPADPKMIFTFLQTNEFSRRNVLQMAREKNIESYISDRTSRLSEISKEADTETVTEPNPDEKFERDFEQLLKEEESDAKRARRRKRRADRAGNKRPAPVRFGKTSEPAPIRFPEQVPAPEVKIYSDPPEPISADNSPEAVRRREQAAARAELAANNAAVFDAFDEKVRAGVQTPFSREGNTDLRSIDLQRFTEAINEIALEVAMERGKEVKIRRYEGAVSAGYELDELTIASEDPLE